MTTHVANGSHYDIYAMVDADRSHISSLSASVKSVSVQGSVQMIHVAKSEGYTLIRSGQFLPFHPDCQISSSVYISILSRGDDADTYELVCGAYPVKRDYSVVVGKDGQVHPVEYGKIWIDTCGKNYKLS